MTVLATSFLTIISLGAILLHIYVYKAMKKNNQDSTSFLILGAPVCIFMVYNLYNSWVGTFELIALRGG